MSGARSGELVVVQQFPEEAAGEMVGWVHVDRTVDEHATRVHAAIAVARVGEQGAMYAYEEVDRPGRDEPYEIPHVEGFGPSVELVVSGQPGVKESIAPQPLKVPRWIHHRRSEDYFGDGFYPEDLPAPEKGVWALGSQNILNALKNELNARQAMWLYPAIYYTLAQLAPDDEQLADPAMRGMTEVEARLADYRYRKLLGVQKVDADIAGRLDNYSAADHAAIVRDFVTARCQAANLEQEASEILTFSAFSSARLYLPVGHGKGGRTWPYMDASERDEEKAFGRELAALRGRNYGFVRREVREELGELRYRIENAREIVVRLALLNEKETALAEAVKTGDSA